MNDFTKEELKTIYMWGMDRVEAIGLSEFKEEGGDSVYNKIGALIENYCEHEWKTSYRLKEHEICIKCSQEF